MPLAIYRTRLAAAAILMSVAAHAEAFSTSALNPTPVPANGFIASNFPAGQGDSSYYFAVDLKAGELASQISLGGGAQYKSLDFALLDRKGQRIDAYYTTAGENDNSEATRVFPIDTSGKYLIRLTMKGSEATTFRMTLGGTALASRSPATTPDSPSGSFAAPSPVAASGVIDGSFPPGKGNSYYYYGTDLKAGNLLTQISVAGRDGATKWMSLTLLDDKGRPDKTYFMSKVEAKADATRSFPIDHSGHYVLRVTLQGAEATKYKVELGGDALAARK